MPNSFRQKPHDRIADWRTSGQGLAALRDFGPANDRIGSKAGIRRGQLNVRFTPDCVAKLFAAPRKSNCRMRLNAVLNRCCVPVLVLESRLPNLAAKIVLQHNPPISGHRSTRRACPLGARTGREQMQQYACRHQAYSITSSARTRIPVGNSMPIALATLRLITSSNFDACSTGRSAGLVPLSTRAT